ncbi:metallophosphoesterase family protein [Curtobacterium flaccumfaciens]|uniref:metallophosphoesterase family protein n=1 Tax=Curtobacterium flaccumfaciens TaxID=2035 RepID=UPI001ADAA37A|nr:metallophosphoesterase [Curtobacterium flaccumfaciens]MBO9049516.1 metallophosphoesterase [Curtobacterium flaccumfaciens pv. flaccumfaciens]
MTRPIRASAVRRPHEAALSTDHHTARHRDRLSPSQRRLWPTPTGAPNFDLTYPNEHRVAIAGDWESDWPSVAAMLTSLRRQAPDIETILHLGDLRYEAPRQRNTGLPRRRFVSDLDELLGQLRFRRLILTPGNHDWWDQLHDEFERHPDRMYRISPRIWIAPRGFRFHIGEATFMSFGGAVSLDRRPDMRSSKSAEEPTRADMNRASHGGPVDVLLTHEPPEAGIPEVDAITSDPQRWPPERLAQSAQSRALITDLVAAITPAKTFHGHMHVRGEAHTQDGRSTFSLAVTGKPGNVGVLTVSRDGFLDFVWKEDLSTR